MKKTKILRWATRKTATTQADATSVLKRSEWKDLMKREFLKNLGLTDEQVNQIMTENGNDIEKYRKEINQKRNG